MSKIGFYLGIIIAVIIGSLLFSKNNKMKEIEVGAKLPEFKLKDQNGTFFDSKLAIGKPMVIYFYPKDDTPGCTKEACKFRDEFEQFTDLGALVIGISADSVESHKDFADKYRLPFLLLADEKNEVRKLFGVPKSMFLLPGRVTYIINKEGFISYIFNSQFGAEKHIDKALQQLQNNKKVD